MTTSRTLKSVCVFCGSRPGSEPVFMETAARFGRAVAERGLTLVYGGARVGLMGAMADEALRAGGRVVGVIPKSLVAKEIAHDGLTELFLTDTMHERKNRMMALSDAFIALPGGFGTFDELFEVITLSQIGIHQKVSALLNIAGFYDPLVALVRHTVATSFAAPQHEGLIVVDDDPDRLLDKVAAWTPPPLGEKWVDRRSA